MNTIETTVQNGRITVDAPVDIPDGTRVIIEVTPAPTEKIGIDESDWRDDPEALADWEAWVKTIEPLEWTPGERTDIDRFEEAFRRFNIEAVRKQMELGFDQ